MRGLTIEFHQRCSDESLDKTHALHKSGPKFVYFVSVWGEEQKIKCRVFFFSFSRLACGEMLWVAWANFGPRFMVALRCWLRHCEAYMFSKLPATLIPACQFCVPAASLPLCAAFCARFNTALNVNIPPLRSFEADTGGPCVTAGDFPTRRWWRADQPPCRCTCRRRSTHPLRARQTTIPSSPIHNAPFVFPTHEAKLTWEDLLASPPRCQTAFLRQLPFLTSVELTRFHLFSFAVMKYYTETSVSCL